MAISARAMFCLISRWPSCSGPVCPYRYRLGASALLLALVVGGYSALIAALRQNRPADYSVIAVGHGRKHDSDLRHCSTAAADLRVCFWPGCRSAAGAAGICATSSCPILTLALPQIAIVARLMRGSMIESLRSHHIRTARAMGLSDFSVVVKHALRGAILPIVSYAGPAAAALLTGSIIVETIFSIPGIGRYFVEAALNRDYTLVMGTVVVIAVFTILFNLIVDLLYAMIDPRVRYD